MIRVLVADDHRLVRRGIREIIGMAEDIEVVGECANGDEICASLNAMALPDVLILDMVMPGLTGAELIRHLLGCFKSIHILVLSMHNEGQFVARALQAGAKGYVTKDTAPEVLIQAVRTIAAGGKFVDPVLVEELLFEMPNTGAEADCKLSERELQVLRLVVAGKSLNAIAVELRLSPKTISSHKARIMQKVGVTNNADLVRYAMQPGISAN